MKFRREFLSTVNPKHYSNEEETPKLLKEVIVPCIQNQKKARCLDSDYPALDYPLSLIMDVFKRKMTPVALNMLKANNIFLTKVSVNMTKFHQPLDLTVNGYPKSFRKRIFTEWSASKICEALKSGKTPKEVDGKMKFSILKPLQAGWIIKLFDKMTSLRGNNVILKCWEKAGINNGIKIGTAGLSLLDPFDEFDPTVRDRKENFDYELMVTQSINKDRLVEGCTTVQGENGDDSKWEDPNDGGWVLDIFDDDES